MRKKILVLVLIIFLSFGSIVTIEADTAQAVLPLILAPELVSIAGSLLVSAGLTFASNPGLYSAISSFAYRYAPAWSEITQFVGSVGVGQSVIVTGTIANALNNFVNEVMSSAVVNPTETVTYQSYQDVSYTIPANTIQTIQSGQTYYNLTWNVGFEWNIYLHAYFTDGTNNQGVYFRLGATSGLGANYIRGTGFNKQYDFNLNAVDGVNPGFSLVYTGDSIDVYDRNGVFVTGVQYAGKTISRVDVKNYYDLNTTSNQLVTSNALLGQDTMIDSNQALKDLTGASVNVADGTTLLNKTVSDIGVQLASQTSILDDVRTGIRSLVDALSLTAPLDLSPLSVNADVLSTKFPFSLPWDLKNSLEVLNVTGDFQPFIVTFYDPLSTILPGVDPHIAFTIDPKPFTDVLVPIVRAGFLLLFGIGLILITPKLFGGSS